MPENECDEQVEKRNAVEQAMEYRKKIQNPEISGLQNIWRDLKLLCRDDIDEQVEKRNAMEQAMEYRNKI